MEDILYKNSPSDIRIREMVSITANQNKHDYSKDYLTFEALEDGTIKFQYNNLREDADDDELYELFTEGIDIDNNYIEYSTDNGNSWIKLTQVNWDSATIVVSKGDKVLARGVNNTFYVSANSYVNTFSFLQGTSHVKVYGNIKTIYGEQELEPSCFSQLFSRWNMSNKSELLVNAQYLVLPYTKLVNSCYEYMFQFCTSLTTAPELPATTLANGCYNSMFHGCTSLTKVPELPATTLADNCYQDMFNGCTSLVKLSHLPATILANNCYLRMFAFCTSLTTVPSDLLSATTLTYGCYYSMFQGCTSLTTAPVLPATTLAQSCYNSMFGGCTSLNYIKAMFTTTPSTTYTGSWVDGVAASGTFVKNSAAQWNVTGNNGIPSGWTVETSNS